MTRFAVGETDWADPAGETLRKAMDVEMQARYADRLKEHLAQAERLGRTLGVDAGRVAYVGVVHDGEIPVGHVALLRREDGFELKRMYVAPSHRGSGVSVALLDAAEAAARARGVSRVVLQTGDRQPDAVRLYERHGYTRIPIFPPYDWLPFSICMEKLL